MLTTRDFIMSFLEPRLSIDVTIVRYGKEVDFDVMYTTMPWGKNIEWIFDFFHSGVVLVHRLYNPKLQKVINYYVEQEKFDIMVSIYCDMALGIEPIVSKRIDIMTDFIGKATNVDNADASIDGCTIEAVMAMNADLDMILPPLIAKKFGDIKVFRAKLVDNLENYIHSLAWVMHMNGTEIKSDDIVLNIDLKNWSKTMKRIYDPGRGNNGFISFFRK